MNQGFNIFNTLVSPEINDINVHVDLHILTVSITRVLQCSLAVHVALMQYTHYIPDLYIWYTIRTLSDTCNIAELY